MRSSSSIPNLDSIQQHADVTIGNAKPNQPQGRQSKFVVCEICDEQIKNSNQLRIHMESMHEIKVKGQIEMHAGEYLFLLFTFADFFGKDLWSAIQEL